ncbi:hypothetical protein RRSWK_04141 [Rhodopirellula sp. SWK7]|nr:hypothetical protein RRSWK_04141 [Rhodopirellula sp. SWK7]
MVPVNWCPVPAAWLARIQSNDVGDLLSKTRSQFDGRSTGCFTHPVFT